MAKVQVLFQPRSVDWFETRKIENVRKHREGYLSVAEFEDENEKYFKRVFYENRITQEKGLTGTLFTAKEAGQYNAKYSVLLSVGDSMIRNNEAFARKIKNFLREI